MNFQLRQNSTLRRALGDVSSDLLEYSLGVLTIVLPHVETLGWSVENDAETSSQATFSDSDRRELRLSLWLTIEARSWTIHGTLRRRRMPAGVGAISRTIDLREKDVASCVMRGISEMFRTARTDDASIAAALRATFEERVVSQHLRNYHDLEIDLAAWFVALRQLGPW